MSTTNTNLVTRVTQAFKLSYPLLIVIAILGIISGGLVASYGKSQNEVKRLQEELRLSSQIENLVRTQHNQGDSTVSLIGRPTILSQTDADKILSTVNPAEVPLDVDGVVRVAEVVYFRADELSLNVATIIIREGKLRDSGLEYRDLTYLTDGPHDILSCGESKLMSDIEKFVLSRHTRNEAWIKNKGTTTLIGRPQIVGNLAKVFYRVGKIPNKIFVAQISVGEDGLYYYEEHTDREM